MKSFSALLLLFTTLALRTVHATPITIGHLSSNDDGSTEVIVDTLNQRLWLRWDVLAALDYDQTLAAIAPTGAWAGWHIAHEADAQMFVNALVGLPNDCANGTSEYCAQYFIPQGFGILTGDNYSANPTGTTTTDSAWFLIDGSGGQSSVGFLQTHDVLQLPPSEPGYVRKTGLVYTDPYLTDIWSQNGQASSTPISWLLYRDAPSVPEPLPLTLMLLALGTWLRLRWSTLHA